MGYIRKINFKTDIIPKVHDYIAKSRKLREYIKSVAREEFLKIQTEFLREFDNHPVTKEIKIGPRARNTSNTLPGVTHGNLFGFIGFPRGSGPITRLRKILQEYKIKIYSRSGRTYISITVPTKQEIFEKTPIPSWDSGRSWVRAIESGIPGLNRYIFYKRVKSKSGRSMRMIRQRFASPYPSRSGGGIQTKKPIRSTRYIPKKYMSDMLSRYRRNIKNLRKGRVF